MTTLRSELYKALLAIPKGKVASYGTLAKHFHTSPRAIASMLAANTELELYPCYKVIHTDGTIGGYRGGVEEKIRKLEDDEIRINQGKIDLGKYEFRGF